MREVSTIMRDSSTKLPFWRSATAYDGVPNLLRALEGWLGADARTPDAGKPRAQLRTTCLLTSALSHVTVLSLTQSHRGRRLGDQRGAWVCADAARPRLGAGRRRAAQALGCRCPAPAVRPVQRAGGHRSAGCLGERVRVPVWPQADGGGQGGALSGPAAQAVRESGPHSDAERRQGQGEEHAGGGSHNIREEEAKINRVILNGLCFLLRTHITQQLVNAAHGGSDDAPSLWVCLLELLDRPEGTPSRSAGCRAGDRLQDTQAERLTCQSSAMVQ